MSTIKIKVIPRAKHNKVIQEENRLKIYTTTPAIDGKANKAVVKLLAKFFDIKKSGIRIIKGEKTREKIVEIEKDNTG